MMDENQTGPRFYQASRNAVCRRCDDRSGCGEYRKSLNEALPLTGVVLTKS